MLVSAMLSFVNYHLLTEAPIRMGAGVAILVFAVSQLSTPQSMFQLFGSHLTLGQVDGLFKALVAGIFTAILFHYKKRNVVATVKSTPQAVVNPVP